MYTNSLLLAVYFFILSAVNLEGVNSSSDLLPWLYRYDVVFPRKLGKFHNNRQPRDINKKNGKDLWHGFEKYPQHVSFSVKINKTTYIVDLSLNKELFAKSFWLSIKNEVGSTKNMTKQEQTFIHCYYQGKVRGIAKSHVAISTCYGFDGYINLSDEFLIVHPINEIKHIVYRPSDDKRINPSLSGNISEDKRPLQNMSVDDRNMRDWLDKDDKRSRETRRKKRNIMDRALWVELSLVMDGSEFSKWTVLNVQKRMATITNYIDGFFKQFKSSSKHLIRVVLSKAHPRLWLAGSNDAAKILDEFLTAVNEGSLVDAQADNVQLIYGGDFDGNIMSMAPLGSMCSPRSGGVNQASGSAFATARTIAHSIGHNLGLQHTTPSCFCDACVMSEKRWVSGVIWSNCDYRSFENSMKLGLDSCLANLPQETALMRTISPTCGNFIVERDSGEQCDCGKPVECRSVCCDPKTCKFARYSVCDGGDCCVRHPNDTCTFKPAATVCRGATNECDLSEYCTGTSGHCPDNMYMADLTGCDKSTAYCFGGICKSLDAQCEAIWGSGATSSSERCYKQVNTLGEDYGNCGMRADGNFYKCPVDDALCGKLQCEGGAVAPVAAGDLPFESLQFKARTRTTTNVTRNVTLSVSGARVTNRTRVVHTGTQLILYDRCRALKSPGTRRANAHDRANAGMVGFGTKCGQKAYCGQSGSQHVCIATEEKDHWWCSNNRCHNRGVCNNLGMCHCNRGWAPPDCSTPGPGGSKLSGPASPATGNQSRSAEARQKLTPDMNAAGSEEPNMVGSQQPVITGSQQSDITGSQQPLMTGSQQPDMAGDQNWRQGNSSPTMQELGREINPSVLRVWQEIWNDVAKYEEEQKTETTASPTTTAPTQPPVTSTTRHWIWLWREENLTEAYPHSWNRSEIEEGENTVATKLEGQVQAAGTNLEKTWEDNLPWYLLAGIVSLCGFALIGYGLHWMTRARAPNAANIRQLQMQRRVTLRKQMDEQAFQESMRQIHPKIDQGEHIRKLSTAIRI